MVSELVDEKTQLGHVRTSAAVASSPQLATLEYCQAPVTRPPNENASGIKARAAQGDAPFESGKETEESDDKMRMRMPVQAAPDMVDESALEATGVKRSLCSVVGSRTASAETEETLSWLRRMIETRARQQMVKRCP